MWPACIAFAATNSLCGQALTIFNSSKLVKKLFLNNLYIDITTISINSQSEE